MAISATFLADFSDFLGEADKADTKLKGLKENADKVGPSLDKAVGGAPSQFRNLAGEASGADSVIKGLHGSVDRMDNVLGAAGISLGPIPGALKDLGQAAGKTAGELGGLSTAGLAVGAAIGGWNIGRAIAEFAGTDKLIGDSVAAFMGWGDVAKEEAAAVAQTLEIASKKAGRAITDIKEAIKVNTEAAFVPYSERVRLAAAELDKLGEAQIREIQAAQQLGVSQKEITERFKISEGALKTLGERTREKEAADREAAAAAKKHADEVAKQREAMAEVNTATQGYTTTIAQLEPKLVEQIRLGLEAGVAQGTLATAYNRTAGEVKAVAEALKVEEKAAEEATKRHQEWAKQQVQATQEAGKLWGDYHELRVAQGGTATDQSIAQIERWKFDTIAAMKEAGTYNEETMTAIEAVAKAKLANVGLDWQALGKESRRALEQTAAQAEAMYAYVSSHSDQFTEKQIEDRRRERDEAIRALETWGEQAVFTLETVQEESKETARVLTTSWSEAMDAVRRGQGTMGGSISAPGNVLAGTPPSTWAAKAAEMGGTVRFDDYGNPYVYVPGMNTPGNLSATGTRSGLSQFSYESAYPGMLAPNLGLGGSYTANVNVNTVMGDKHEIARVVKDALADDWRTMGQRA